MVSKYELREEANSDGSISLFIKRPVRNPVKWKTVTPPSWFERLRGITLTQKLEKARAHMRAECEKRNRKIEDAAKLVSDKKLDLSNPPQGGSGLPSRPPKDYGLIDNYPRDDLK